MSAAKQRPNYAPKNQKLRAAPNYLLPGDVHEAALNRLRWVFDEFDEVVISFSGGKDSTVLLHLALQVAEEKGRLPLKVYWLDQECEYQSTVEYMRHVAQIPGVELYWYQIPFRLFNATSHVESWLNVWGEGEEWVRPKEPDSIHENTFGTDRFVSTLDAIGAHLLKDAENGVVLTGVRAEESPARRLGLTSFTCYKWVTWGQKNNKTHLILHPIYDWSFRDIWKAILDGGWTYNESYDHQFRHGVKPHTMRVSNYHHETAVHSLFWLQEVEPETWERATARVQGISTAGHMGKRDFFQRELPYMFRDWTEYRDYLLDHLPGSPEDAEVFGKQFRYLDRQLWYTDPNERSKAQVQALIANDLYFTKLNQFYVTHYVRTPELERLGLRREDFPPDPPEPAGAVDEPAVALPDPEAVTPAQSAAAAAAASDPYFTPEDPA